jgi:hypothetical protein
MERLHHTNLIIITAELSTLLTVPSERTAHRIICSMPRALYERGSTMQQVGNTLKNIAAPKI